MTSCFSPWAEDIHFTVTEEWRNQKTLVFKKLEWEHLYFFSWLIPQMIIQKEVGSWFNRWIDELLQPTEES